MEFHRLRDYRAGDSLRQIDWKATSRYRRAISREYQEERDQQVMFLLDCGRKMHALDGNLSHFDYTLNALLLLANVALRQGDSVGLMTFSGEQRWLAPRKGVSTLNLLLNSIYDLSTSTAPSDYLNAALQAQRRLSKRSLIVVMSNLRDEDSEELTLALQILRRKHLVLLASLRETVLGETLDADVTSFDQALRVAATHRYLTRRRTAHERLTANGALWLDVEPAQLSVQLVNRYLDVKTSGRL